MCKSHIATRRVLLLAAAALAALALLAGWLALPADGQAGAASPAHPGQLTPDPAITNISPTADPDSQWLALARAQSQGRAAPQAAFSIDLNLTASSLAGSAPSVQVVEARVLRGGYLAATGYANPVPQPGGGFYQINLQWQSIPCDPAITCGVYAFLPGDQVWVSQAGAQISMTVPILNALAEPQNDTLYGLAPAGSALTAYLLPFADPTAVYTLTGSADGSGAYLLALPDPPGLHRRDTGYLLAEPQPDRRAYVYWVAPFLRLQVGGAVLSGMAPPNAELLITVTQASGEPPLIFKPDTGPDGVFEIEFGGSYSFDPVPSFNPGDRLTALSGGQTFTLTVPLLSAAADPAGGTISGDAPPGAALEVRNYRGPLVDVEAAIWEATPAETVPALASPAGEYSAALTLQPGDYGAAFLALADENQAYARYAVPYLSAVMGVTGMTSGGEIYRLPIIAGQVEEPLAPITVSVQGPSGYLKDWLAWRAGNGGEFSIYAYFFGNTPPVILPGDTVIVQVPSGEAIVLPMPELTAEASRALPAVSGQAPPGAIVTVTAYNWEAPYPPVYPPAVSVSDGAPLGGGNEYPPGISLTVAADSAGNYLADFSGLAAFNDYTYGVAAFTVASGDGSAARVARYWSLGACPPLPDRIQVGGNRLILDYGPFCPDASLRLLDAAGNEKFSADYLYGQEWIDLYTPEGVPIPILPGDRLQISAQGETSETRIPRLALAIDPHTFALSGQAPPGARLEVSLASTPFNGPTPTPVVVTATQAGAFTAGILNGYGYHPGDTLRARLLDAPVETFALALLPRLSVQLYDYQEDAWLPPLSPYTLTLTTPITQGQRTGYAPTDGRILYSIDAPNYGTLHVVPGSALRLESPAGDAALDVPLLTAVVDLPSARVSGQAPPNAALRLYFYGEQGYNGFSTILELTAGLDGRFSADFPEYAPLKSAAGSLTYIDASGNEAYTTYFSPRLSATLDEKCVEGFGPNPGGEISLTLTRPGGGFSQTVTGTASLAGAWFDLCFDRPVLPGDRLELSAAGERLIAYTALNLDTEYDTSRQVLLGWAPPGSSPEVTFVNPQGVDVARRPMQEPDGSFGIDASDLGLRLGDRGRLTAPDAQGNSTVRWFTVTGYPVYLPVVYQ